MWTLLLAIACLGHHPYHPYYGVNYNVPSFYFYYSLPPAAGGTRIVKPQITNTTLASMGYRNRMLTLLAQNTNDFALKEQYLTIKKQIEVERLRYLMRSSYTPPEYRSPGEKR